MIDIIKNTRYKIFYISPKDVKYCIYPSKKCDYTQFQLSKLHPHAGKNRGVFREDPMGYIKINNSEWDKRPGILFSSLLEYQALVNHFKGKQNWKDSKFSKRYFNYIQINKLKDRNLNYKNKNDFLNKREKQIDKLFELILKQGVLPANNKKNKKLFIDNISLVLTDKNELYFNNRGHHRLSIAKILGLSEIPIKITLAKSTKKLEIFNSKINYIKT